MLYKYFVPNMGTVMSTYYFNNYKNGCIMNRTFLSVFNKQKNEQMIEMTEVQPPHQNAKWLYPYASMSLSPRKYSQLLALWLYA